MKLFSIFFLLGGLLFLGGCPTHHYDQEHHGDGYMPHHEQNQMGPRNGNMPMDSESMPMNQEQP